MSCTWHSEEYDNFQLLTCGAIPELLSRNPNLQECDSKGFTLLTRAADNGSIPQVKALLDYGADVNQRDKNGRLPLSIAVKNDNPALVKVLIDLGADRNLIGVNLMHRVQTVRMVKLLVSLGIDPDQRDEQGQTPLFWVAHAKNCYDLIHALLDAGANINAVANDGYTPLLDAVLGGYGTEAVVILLEAGAKIDLRMGNEGDEWTMEQLIFNLTHNGRMDLIEACCTKGYIDWRLKEYVYERFGIT